MKINVYGRKTLISSDVRKYVEEKIGKVEHYRNDIIGVDLTLELDHNKKKKTAATAKALVKIPGNDVTAKVESRTLYAAIDQLEKKLNIQLKKKKDKRVGLKKRLSGGRKAVRGLFKRGE